MPRLLRSGNGRVTNAELLFDLVYVFAVTQLARHLVGNLSVDGAVQTAALLAMVWQVWVYTTWMTNYLDPDRQLVRLALMVLLVLSLALSAAIPYAFGARGWLLAALYVVMQVGRSVFVALGVRGDALELAFWRIGAWCAVGAVAMLVGAAAHGHARELLWAAGVAVELVGASIGFAFPGLGRSSTTEWTISGGHFAERCQAFVLIALGESIVVIGTSVVGLEDPAAHVRASDYLAVAAALAGAIALWWVYFDRAAEDSARVIDASDDPGRLARDAFHWVHPLIVAGIVVSAAADERVLEHPQLRGVTSTSLLVVGGFALFLGGHAVFKAVVFRAVSWSRIVAVIVLLLLLVLAPHLTAVVLSAASVVVVLGVIVADRITHPDVLEEAA